MSYTISMIFNVECRRIHRGICAKEFTDMVTEPQCFEGRLNKSHFPEIGDFCSVKDLTKRDGKISCGVGGSLCKPQIQ